jgi:hypothetical protein
MHRQCLVVVVGLLFAGCSKDPVPSSWVVLPLGKGQITVRAPADYQQGAEIDDTLVLTPPGDLGIILRFTLHWKDAPGAPKDMGHQFVRSLAKEKNLSVREKGGKTIVTETEATEEMGRKGEVRFWLIGLGKGMIVMSASVPDDRKDLPAVQECLDKTVPLMIDSLKLK